MFSLTKRHLWFFLYLFVVLMFPLFNYPLTDGDIVNWAKVSRQIQLAGDFWTVASDQGHGPLMAWMGVWGMNLFGNNFFGLNFFNLIFGVLGLYFVFGYATRILNDQKVGYLAGFIYCVSLAPVYLSRTPMYDWPAAILYFGFTLFYMLYVKEGKWRYFIVSLCLVGIASLSRFSISLGLAGIYMLGVSFIYKRSLLQVFRDGFVIIFAIFLFNYSWLMGQIQTFGSGFLKTFLYDNTGRFVKSTRPDAVVRKDFYGFTLYVLVGMIPYTFCLINSVFNRQIWGRIKQSMDLKVLLVAFLPCLILFSISGHTKLGRYIAYVFPSLIMFISVLMVQYDLLDLRYRKRCGRMIAVTMVLIGIILLVQVLQFSSEAQSSLLFTLGVCVLLFGLMLTAYYHVTKRYQLLIDHPEKALTPYAIIYCIFFGILAFESTRAPFLLWVRDGILGVIT